MKPDWRLLRMSLECVGIVGIWATLLAQSGSSKNIQRVPASSFITFDAPGAAKGTYPTAMNDSGLIIGFAIDELSHWHGFLRNVDGSFTNIDPPGATIYTFPRSISPEGAITGIFDENAWQLKGFLREPDGTFVIFSLPDSTGTEPQYVNADGVITGYYFTDGAIFGIPHGFVRSAGGSLTTFDAPVASAGIQPIGILTDGTTAGYYEDAYNYRHGFVRTADGTFTSFDPPTSILTEPYSMNASGAITGYFNGKGGDVGFLRSTNGFITTFSIPGATQNYPFSINEGGTITGHYGIHTDFYSGFLRAPDGTLTSFDPPESVVTTPLSINAKGAVTGTFEDASQANHGFLMTSQ